MLGWVVVVEVWSWQFEVYGVICEQVDIVDIVVVEIVFDEFELSVVVNCVVFMQVDQCEEEEERVIEVNGYVVVCVVVVCVDCVVCFFQILMDYVFDGVVMEFYFEDYFMVLIQVYGCGKFVGEEGMFVFGGVVV